LLVLLLVVAATKEVKSTGLNLEESRNKPYKIHHINNKGVCGTKRQLRERKPEFSCQKETAKLACAKEAMDPMRLLRLPHCRGAQQLFEISRIPVGK